MIIRIFKATIPKELHKEFEIKFIEISVPVIKNRKGLISIEIGRPTKWNPEEFVMISKWKNEEDLIDFAGENWGEAYIPHAMEKFIKECTVLHFENIELHSV